MSGTEESTAPIGTHTAAERARLFVAVPLDTRWREELQARIAPLRDLGPHARWVPPNNWHLTLHFLGDTPRASIQTLGEALAETTRACAAFDLVCDGGGAFPGRVGRVLWCGFFANAELLRLVDRVEQVCTATRGVDARPSAKTQPERRHAHEPEKELVPHVTLARADPPWPLGSVRAWRLALDPLRGRRLAVERFELVETKPLADVKQGKPPAGRIRYTPLARIDLATGGGEIR